MTQSKYDLTISPEPSEEVLDKIIYFLYNNIFGHVNFPESEKLFRMDSLDNLFGDYMSWSGYLKTMYQLSCLHPTYLFTLDISDDDGEIRYNFFKDGQYYEDYPTVPTFEPCLLRTPMKQLIQ